MASYTRFHHSFVRHSISTGTFTGSKRLSDKSGLIVEQIRMHLVVDLSDDEGEDEEIEEVRIGAVRSCSWASTSSSA